jgi:hypothetical protein
VQPGIHEACRDVHVCDDATLRVGDPDAAVIELNLGFFDAGRDECEDE